MVLSRNKNNISHLRTLDTYFIKISFNFFQDLMIPKENIETLFCVYSDYIFPLIQLIVKSL